MKKTFICKKKSLIAVCLVVITLCVSYIIFYDGYAMVKVIDKTSHKYVLEPDIVMLPKMIQQGQPGTGGTGPYLYKPVIPIPAIVEVKAAGYKVEKKLIFLRKGKTNTIYLEQY